MTFDEANAKLTEELCGRTIAHVERQGKQLIFVTECGHTVTIQSDVNHDIHYVSTGVRIALPGLDLSGIVGRI